MYWCTSGVGLQVLPVIDNSHLGAFFASIDFLVKKVGGLKRDDNVVKMEWMVDVIVLHG